MRKAILLGSWSICMSIELKMWFNQRRNLICRVETGWKSWKRNVRGGGALVVFHEVYSFWWKRTGQSANLMWGSTLFRSVFQFQTKIRRKFLLNIVFIRGRYKFSRVSVVCSFQHFMTWSLYYHNVIIWLNVGCTTLTYIHIIVYLHSTNYPR